MDNGSSNNSTKLLVVSLSTLAVFFLVMMLLMCVFLKKWVRILSAIDDVERRADAANPATAQLSAFSWDKSFGGSSIRINEQTECSICLSAINNGDMATILPNCNHYFHMACVHSWISLQATCPLCRCSIIAPEPQQLAHSYCHGHALPAPLSSSFSEHHIPTTSETTHSVSVGDSPLNSIDGTRH